MSLCGYTSNVQYHKRLTYIFNFWHSGTLVLRAEHQSARMSEMKITSSLLNISVHYIHFARLAWLNIAYTVSQKGGPPTDGDNFVKT